MDIENIAVLKVKNEIAKYNCLKDFINVNDRTPMWDGDIFIYKDSAKYNANKDFLGKIGVQVKGHLVKRIRSGNSKYTIEVEYLRAYQKEKKGVLLFVVEMIDFEHSQIFYANLLPVDLKEILSKVKPNQATVTIDIKPIKEKSSSSMKMICQNFLRNSNEQLNIEIKNIEEIKNIKEIKFTVVGEKEYFDDYIFNNGVYAYATENGTNKKYALPKPIAIQRNQKVRASIKVKEKEYYQEIIIIKNANEEYALYGKSTKIYLNSKKINFTINGNLYERIVDISFILDLFENEEYYLNNELVPFPIMLDEKVSKDDFVNTLKNNLIQLVNMKEIFEKYNIKFENDLGQLNSQDLKNLDKFMKLNEGIVSGDIKESQINYIDIANVRIAFLIMLDKNGNVNLYNYFSDLSDKVKVFYIDKDKKEVVISPYLNLNAGNLISFSNVDIDVMKKTFDTEPYSEETCERYTLWMLELIKAYDQSKDDKWLEFAEYLNGKIMNNITRNANVINKYQIIKRKRTLTTDEKEVLYEIKEKETNIMIQCAISILLENKSDYERAFSKMNESEKKQFEEFPIFNLVK